MPFCNKVLCTAFLLLQLGLIIFKQKNIGAKAARKMLVELTPGVDFINMFTSRFQKHKNSVNSVSFCAFRIYKRKSCSKNVGEIDNSMTHQNCDDN